MTLFKVKIENFEGPIDVLLQMIEKRKMPINDISLAHIADDYLHFVNSLENEPLLNATHFIFVASTLTLIKSKSLLPTLELSQEEEGDIEDLKRRIEIFKQFQIKAELLQKSFHKYKRFYYARNPKREIQFSPHKNISLANIHLAMTSVFKKLPEKEIHKKEATIRIAVHIDEMMSSLESRIKECIKMDFDSFLAPHLKKNQETKSLRVYKVVGFLAMLELVKKGSLDVVQQENFSQINLSSREI